MRILLIADSPAWAIGKIAREIVRHNPHHAFDLLYVHPKNVEAHVGGVRAALAKADLVHFLYWRTATQLVELMPELAQKPKVLSHFNQKNLAGDWGAFEMVTCCTKKSHDFLRAAHPNVRKIYLAAELDYFTFIEDYPPKIPSVGYVGRVVPWKGLKEIAAVCHELGYPIVAMGRMDKPEYWAEISHEHQANINVDFMGCPDDRRQDAYRDMTIYVGFSGDNHEEGTMPLLEAMACGVPVVTTPSGIAADIIEDQKNGLVVKFGDVAGLRVQIKRLMEDAELREKLRQEAWNTVKNFPMEKMALEYGRLYAELLHPNEPMVSVIVPFTIEQTDRVPMILNTFEQEAYKNIEVILCLDDSTNDAAKAKMREVQQAGGITVKYVETGKTGSGYGLAKARNMGVVEAEGRVLMFCDSRLKPEPGAVKAFADAVLKAGDKKRWFFGDKGGGKRNFVENFSAIRRDHFIKAGMMNERIDRYGGMSQELRERFQSQGFEFVYLEEAKATELASSKRTLDRRADIIASKLKLWKLGL